jgi:hypothetical protein
MRTILCSHPILLGTVVLAALAAACSAGAGRAAAPTAPALQAADSTPAHPRERLELKVRADFFAGMAGDTAAFARAMKVCDDALAANPSDAEALVWRGAGRLFESGTAYRSGNMAGGQKLWDQALGEMDRAVSLEPDNLGVRIPRGAALLGAGPHVPDPALARTLFVRAADDYEVTLKVQEPYLSRLSTHAREELFYGLADARSHLGDEAGARAYVERLVREVPDSQLLPYARAWLAGTRPDTRPDCAGCHTG